MVILHCPRAVDNTREKKVTSLKCYTPFEGMISIIMEAVEKSGRKFGLMVGNIFVHFIRNQKFSILFFILTYFISAAIYCIGNSSL